MANTDVGVGSNVTFSNVKIDPTVIGGVTIGYDFVNAGFLAYNWPDWMKYFGVAGDFTYNNISIRSGQTTAEIAGINILPRPFFGPAQGSRLKGFVAATTFLFYGHYGFFPDSEIPVGRVHPYLGVGPAIVVSGLDLGSYGIGNKVPQMWPWWWKPVSGGSASKISPWILRSAIASPHPLTASKGLKFPQSFQFVQLPRTGQLSLLIG